jgi:hypothetical protein
VTIPANPASAMAAARKPSKTAVSFPVMGACASSVDEASAGRHHRALQDSIDDLVGWDRIGPAGLMTGSERPHLDEDWLAAARSIDVGIELLANASKPPPILGMLMCIRGECDVYNGDAKSAVARRRVVRHLAGATRS